MRFAGGLPRRTVLIVGAVSAVLAAGITVAIAASTGAFRGHDAHSAAAATGAGLTSGASAGSCSDPAVPGARIQVALWDRGGAMMGGGMSDGGMMGGQSGWRNWYPGMMGITAAPSVAARGTVSLVARNDGSITHELVVLPLAAGQRVGARAVGSDGTVSEAGSLGEASRDCAEGAGEGISPGATGWVTLHLPAGRYELVCNIAGHYRAGMYAELDVS